MSDPTLSLIEDGRLAEAAALLEERGDAGRAITLYEQLWDHDSARRLARATGDLPRALLNALRGGDRSAADDIIETLETGGDGDALRRSANVCRERGAHALAARLYASAGDLDESAASHERAGNHLDAARVHETRGRLRAAIEQARRHVAHTEADDPHSAEAALLLGRLLLRFGRHAEAAPLLQRAVSQPGEHRALAAKAIVAALARLGYPHAARVAFEEHADDLVTVDGIEACTGDPRLAPQGTGPDDERDVLAGRYRLGVLIGSGGMGRVYRARDLLKDREVAVKIFTAPAGVRGRDIYLRFVREAVTTGQLDHPHIVALIDFNEELGFLVLELMAGGSLADRAQTRLSLNATRSIMLQIVSALAAAHQRGIVHRDIKPSNIFFSGTGAAKLGDFGVAHLQDAGQTATGAFIGTLAYMSPEQITGSAVTFATDLYALGVTFFAMVTGDLPFSPPDLIDKHLNAPPPRPSTLRPGLPVICDDIAARCLAKDPADRFASLGELTAALRSMPVEEASFKPAGSDAVELVLDEPARRETDDRYDVESKQTLGDVEIAEALDSELGRPVTLVRVAPGPARARLVAIIAAAARGDAHLQRVLAFDDADGSAVVESFAGEALSLETQPDAVDRYAMCEHLGEALAPLHRAGLPHRAVAAESLRVQDGFHRLSLVASIRAHAADPAPEDDAAAVRADVDAALELCGIDAEGAPTDGSALATWARRARSA